MKVLHISTNCRGGAGIAAVRSHQALKAAGVESRILLLGPCLRFIEGAEFIQPKAPSIFARFLRRVGIYSTKFLLQESIRNRLKRETLTEFSIPQTDYRIHQNHLIQWADVIHLHWISDLLDYPTFFKHVQKPIIWTLHDMHPFQGGFHYSSEVKRAKKNIQIFEKHLKQYKELATSQVCNLQIICPSRWLLAQSTSQAAFKNRPHHHLFNTLDQSIYKPIDKKACREILNIGTEEHVIMFAAESLSNHRKGFDLLVEALEHIKSKKQLRLLIVGHTRNPITLPFPCTTIGSVESDFFMAVLYSAADYFVLSSREDNLPNVILESLSCGTPVITTPSGGCVEMIRNGKNGLISSEISSISLAYSIEKALDHSFESRNEIRLNAELMFNNDNHVKQLLHVYDVTLSVEGKSNAHS